MSHEAVICERLDPTRLDRGRSRSWVHLGEDARGTPWLAPVLALRAEQPGPVVGITAAIHGNELNGVVAIHQLFDSMPAGLRYGTVIGIPVVNVPGFLLQQREFEDGTDLNRIMPGRGNDAAHLYARRVFDRLIAPLDLLIDLHTASFGRVNSLYVRADVEDPITARMAWLQSPSIVVHNAADGTLRGAARALGIPAITVEIGDPQQFQQSMVFRAARGVRNVLEDLEMVERDEFEPGPHVRCAGSEWIYTERGGLLEVLPDLCAHVAKGTVIARLRDLFGTVLAEYAAPYDAIVIGKSTNPVASAGARIAHLGRVAALEYRPREHASLRDLWRARLDDRP